MKLRGFLTITEKAPKEYDELKWKGDKALVLYRLGVNPLNRKEGVATRLMQFAEQLAFEQGIRFLKGDTSELNVGMNRLFIKLQYEKVGQISIGDKEFLFNCYEKELIE